MKSVFLLFCFFCLARVNSQSPIAFFHDRVDTEEIGGIPLPVCAGETFEIHHHMSELDSVGWENRAVGVGNFIGPWIFYGDRGYNGDNWVFYNFLSQQGGCISFLDGPVGSARAVGPEHDWQENSITVYEETLFRETEAMFTEHQPSVSLNIKSLILTGSAPWTIFKGENLTGDSLCVFAEDFTFPTPYSDTLLLSTPFEHGSIRSIYKGCELPTPGRTSSPVTQLYFKA